MAIRSAKKDQGISVEGVGIGGLGYFLIILGNVEMVSGKSVRLLSLSVC